MSSSPANLVSPPQPQDKKDELPVNNKKQKKTMEDSLSLRF
jgi:hypothetical protein